MTESNVLVRARGLVKTFPVRRSKPWAPRVLKAVDGVSLDINAGETFGLVGESGCGKSTLGRVLTALYEPQEGTVELDGENIFRGTTVNRTASHKTVAELKSLRKKMQFIFQDPSASLNPRRTIKNILLEPFRIHNVGTKAEREEKIRFLMERVGLPSYHLSRYPHELSGGQKQRVGIARALALNPKFIVCDEAVSALDVSIQAQVINLLADLQNEYALTYLFISHNLSVVHHVSTHVAVMYLGKLVEYGTHDSIYADARHPYTRALLSAIPGSPVNRERGGGRIVLEGDVPSPVEPPAGCRFHTRCSQCREICKAAEPPSIEVTPGHFVSCNLY
jgi:peptide/nickel transport system ATP-binding protein/oligopeptide transport system ATP-binding protein